MNTTAGTIYEKDHVTIVSNDGIYDEMPMFSDSNFKFKIGADRDGKRRHTRGAWVKPNEDESGETWTLSTISGHVITEETTIVEKPNYSSLKDFAYYGSAVELIKATVNDVILRFPGGISYYGNLAPEVTVNGEKYYLVSNEFKIDFWTQGDVYSGDVKNPLRILASSYTSYVNKDGETAHKPELSITGNCLDSIIGTIDIEGETLLIYMNGDGEKYLVTDKVTSGYTKQDRIIIRPNENIIKEFWNSLDPFERVLLNRDTEPVYTAIFETPYSNDKGYFYTKEKYTWPTVGDDDFTPDITTASFNGYLNSLIYLAQFHDEFDSDNIWRMLTHEAIKNLDWTFIRHEDDETDDLSDFDTSRMKALLNICGRQFDDIKLYAENVKSTNKVTYDEKNNVPDYFLTDKAEYNGWEAKTVAPTNDEDVTTDAISGSTDVSGTTKVWTFEKEGKKPSDVNSDFMRRLTLNSTCINAMKGTRRGIDALLGMFGYEDVSNLVESGHTTSAGTFNIKEYVSIAHNFPEYAEMYRLRARGEYINYGSNTNYMDGYPVTTVFPASGTPYIIPWFNPKESYRNPLYFQEKGGWGRVNKKSINLDITSITEIEETDEVKIYGESESYMRFASTLSDLKNIENADLFENMICYVSDISELQNGYEASPEDVAYEQSILSGTSGTERFNLFSHYFILKKVALSQEIGFVNNYLYYCYGWRNIYNNEFNGEGDLTTDGLRVLYLESLEGDSTGNNPHIGNGTYDDGASYIRRFNYIFEEAVKEGIYDDLKNSTNPDDQADYAAILTSGFCVSFMTPENEDNKKCHFFRDTLGEESELTYLEKVDDNTWEAAEDENENNWDEDFYEKLTIPQFETDVESKHDESAANSVINVKNIRINFGTDGNEFLRKYIETVVIKYLQMVLPSTCILSYTFDGEEIMDDTKFEIYGTESIEEAEASDVIVVEEDQLFVEGGEFGG